MDEEPRVSYPISEVLKEISDKIDKLLDGLNGKADRAELSALEGRVGANEQQIKTLLAANVAEATSNKTRREWRYWIVPVIISTLGVVATVLQVWH